MIKIQASGILALSLAMFALSGCSPANKGVTDAQAELHSAQQQELLGNTQEARRWVDLAIKSDPSDVNLYCNDLTSSTNYDYTIEGVFGTDEDEGPSVEDSASTVYYMRKAVNLFPNNYAPYVYLVNSELTMGDKANAAKDAAVLAALLQTKITQPGNSSNVLSLTLLQADAYCTAGNPTLGVQKYQNLISMEPSKEDPYNGLAYYYAVANDKAHLQEALVDANKAISLAQADSNATEEDVAEYQDTLAWVQYRLGDYTDAQENSENAATTLPTVPEIRYHLAMIYEALGKTDQAKVELSHALLINPLYADALAANAQLAGPVPAAPTKTAMAAGG